MPIPSETLICSNALQFLGEDRITSLDDGTRPSNLCRDWYEATRDSLLNEHPWNFALKRVTLTESSVDPVWEFDHKYPLPNDIIKIIDISPQGAEYQVVGKFIETDEDPFSILYVAQIADTQRFSPLFVEALTFKLAANLAPTISGKPERGIAAFNRYQEAVRKAKISDAQDDSRPLLRSDNLINVRDFDSSGFRDLTDITESTL